MNEELPNVYTQIEEFKDYEFTNCIAYEMMIRNKEVINLIHQFDESMYGNFEKHKSITNILKEKYWFPFSINEIIDQETGEVVIVEERLDGLNLNIYPFIGKLKNVNFYSNNRNCIKTHKYNDGRFIFDMRDNTTSCNNRIEKTTVRPSYLRPTINVPKNFSNKIEVQIDLTLPENEIIDFIKNILKEKKLIKNPLELLGEEFEMSDNKKINKKIIADKFFIYDYITARQEKIKKDNEFRYEEYEEELQDIKNNPYITPNDRKIQLKEKKKEFEENTNTRINELFEDIEDFTPATAKRYYYDIKPFIDDCKYKELITGIKQ